MDNRNIKAYTLAKRANVPESSIKNILYGKSIKPRYELLAALAKILGCSVTDIISDTDPRKNQPFYEDTTKTSVWDSVLYMRIIRLVLKVCRSEAMILSDKEANFYINKIYTYLKNSTHTPLNEQFVRWILKDF